MLFGQLQVYESVLDSSPQKSRIAIKNPRVRPPKDPRSLIHMPSMNPTPSSLPSARTPVGFPVGGLGVGIKLPSRSTAKYRSNYSVLVHLKLMAHIFPGLSGGLPILKKTQTKVRDVNFPNLTLSFQIRDCFFNLDFFSVKIFILP